MEDKIAETRETGTEDIVFGEGFAGISDLEVGPDGYLYVVSLGQGKIFRIVPGSTDASTLLSPATEDAILTGDSEQRRQDLDPIEGGGGQQYGMDEEVDDEDVDVDEGGGEED